MTTYTTAVKAVLPAGYTVRPLTFEDLQAAVDLCNADARATIGTNDLTFESLKHQWETPTFNPEKDTIGIFTPDNQLVSYAEFWDNNDLHIRFFTYGVVHPEYRGQGMGSYLVDWLIEHGRASVEKAPADARVELHQSFLPTAYNEPLLISHGFEQVRTFYTMRINFDTPPQPVTPPEGIVFRAISGDEEKRKAIFGVYESFRDHWGFIDESFDKFLERWLARIKTDHMHDPSLWFIALDGEDVAGISLCMDHIDEDPLCGWVNTLGVRRPWRKHGLGEALLRHSFYELHKRGKPRVGLGVDASSLTGATRLYEKAGMHVHRRMNAYALLLRDGKDYTTQTIQE